MFYTIILTLHSLLRWVIVIFGFYAILRSVIGWFTQADWTKKDDRISLAYTILLDIQLVVGIVLFLFASPITTEALRDLNLIGNDQIAEFFTIRHVIVMVIAVAFANIGRMLARRIAFGFGPHRHAATWFAISMIVIFTAIPWPFMPVARPWLTLFGLTF